MDCVCKGMDLDSGGIQRFFQLLLLFPHLLDLALKAAVLLEELVAILLRRRAAWLNSRPQFAIA